MDNEQVHLLGKILKFKVVQIQHKAKAVYLFLRGGGILRLESGLSARKGPHQLAQKYIGTGFSLLITSSSTLASLANQDPYDF